MSDIVPPCDCAEQVDGRWTSQCYCSNRDDGERTAAWCVEANNADTITTLRATNERLRGSLERHVCDCKSNCAWERDETCSSWDARTALAEEKQK